MTSRSTRQIDKDIDALHEEVRRTMGKDLETSTDWQAAWDQHPDLHAKNRNLCRERHEARMVKRKRVDKLLAKRAARKEKATIQRNTDICPTCHGSGWIDKIAA